MNVKVRFAPSPTGTPHVGNIRTALFNYFFAKVTGGEFILRIEDTDQARIIEGALDAIKDSLKWLGIEWDGYFVQSNNLAEYKKYAQDLMLGGFAKNEEGATRFIVPKKGNISWVDAVGNKKIEFVTSEIEDFIILKADGFPTYHLANVVDDHLMGITHIIRGEDWIPSTPKHILLYQAFGWKTPTFVHVPNVLGEDGKKLSKRRGAKSVLDFKNEGYLAEALLNYLMLLGWSPKDDREILSKKEIIKDFALEKINSAPATFDSKKLDWLNGEYIRMFSFEELKKRVLEFDPSLSVDIPENLFFKFIKIAQTRMKTLAEFKKLVLPFFDNSKKTELAHALNKNLENLTNWEKNEIAGNLKKFLSEKGLHFPDLYEAVIRQKQGLPLADVFEILGKEKTLSFLS